MVVEGALVIRSPRGPGFIIYPVGGELITPWQNMKLENLAGGDNVRVWLVGLAIKQRIREAFYSCAKQVVI